MELSRLQRVELRDIWETEAQDFTPWLAQEENLAILSETIGIELELEAQEKSVGPFRADILCRNLDGSDDESWVLIENQLERTDHNHLGQLLTYASGLHTVTIIWIAAKFSDEHRAALDWLNDITEEKFRFFGLEVELWRIGESPAAPKFNIISKPNDWSRSVSRAARKISEENLTPARQNYLKYWTGLAEFLNTHSNKIKPRKPLPQHWTNLSLGRSGITLHTRASVRDNWIAVDITLRDENAKSFFSQLSEDKDAIEKELGYPIDWLELPDKKASIIRIVKNVDNLMDENSWEQHYYWLTGKLEDFDQVFRERIRNLSVEDWVA